MRVTILARAVLRRINLLVDQSTPTSRHLTSIKPPDVVQDFLKEKKKRGGEEKIKNFNIERRAENSSWHVSTIYNAISYKHYLLDFQDAER